MPYDLAVPHIVPVADVHGEREVVAVHQTLVVEVRAATRRRAAQQSSVHHVRASLRLTEVTHSSDRLPAGLPFAAGIDRARRGRMQDSQQDEDDSGIPSRRTRSRHGLHSSASAPRAALPILRCPPLTSASLSRQWSLSVASTTDAGGSPVTVQPPDLARKTDTVKAP